MKTLAQLKKKEESASLLYSNLRAISKDRIYPRFNWMSKINDYSTLEPKKAIKILNSKKFKELLFDEMREEISNDYNSTVANWFVDILESHKVTEFLWLDTYWSKNLEVSISDDSFNSSYGSHDVKSYNINFDFNGKVHHLKTEKSNYGRG